MLVEQALGSTTCCMPQQSLSNCLDLLLLSVLPMSRGQHQQNRVPLPETGRECALNSVSKQLAEVVNYFMLSFHLGLTEILLQSCVAARPAEIQEAWYSV